MGCADGSVCIQFVGERLRTDLDEDLPCQGRRVVFIGKSITKATRYLVNQKATPLV
jgi:hypothetical protein